MTDLRFYEFDQNNTGGRFDYDSVRGIGEYLYIEASSEAEAVDRLDDLVDLDSEDYCECCGPAWSGYADRVLDEAPVTMADTGNTLFGNRLDEDAFSVVHRADGSFYLIR